MENKKLTNQPTVRKVTWKEIRAKVKKVNPEFYAIIDQIDPSPAYSLYEGIYPYGYESIRKGVFYLPNKNNEVVSIYHYSLDNHLREDLGYNIKSNPLSLILKNKIELFLSMDEYTIPFGLINEGGIVSIGGTLDINSERPYYQYQPAFLWNISSGARSIFFLPKISVSKKYMNFKDKYNLALDPPQNLFDHGVIFKELSNHPEFENKWFCEILYFGKNWFNHINDKSKKWLQFYNFLYKKSWKNTWFWRNEFIYNLIFSLIQKNKNLRPNPYIADTVKHLIEISIGVYPGFSPATNDNNAPISTLQDIFANVYQLEDYLPIIMQPKHFSMYNSSDPVYYSLEYPTTLDFSPKSRKLSNKIIDLSEIIYILDRYLPEINSEKMNLHDCPLNDISNLIKYDFFHSEPRESHNIFDSSKIANDDNNLTGLFKRFPNLKFPNNSPFLNGCIRISNKQTSQNT